MYVPTYPLSAVLRSVTWSYQGFNIATNLLKEKKNLLMMYKNWSKSCMYVCSVRVDFSVYVILSLFFCNVNFALVACAFLCFFFATSIHKIFHSTPFASEFALCSRDLVLDITQPTQWNSYWFCIKASHCCLIIMSPYA